MKETNDPAEVFAQYSDGVTIHENKDITITPRVQRDILDATAMLMAEVNKIGTILALLVNMVESEDTEGAAHACALARACMEHPDEVTMVKAGSPEEVIEIVSSLNLVSIDEEEEVKN